LKWVLQEFLFDEDVVVRQIVIVFCWHMSEDLTNGIVFRETGAIDTIVKLLSDQDYNVRLDAAGALASIASDSLNDDIILKAGGIYALLTLIADEFDARRDALIALSNLAYNEKSRILIDELGGIELLLSVLAAENNLNSVRSTIYVALSELARNRQCQNKIREIGGGLPLLVKALSDSDNEVRSESVQTIKILAFMNIKNVNIIYSCDVMSALLDLFENEDIEIWRDAVGLLWNLTFACSVRSDILQEGEVVTLLVKLLSHEDLDVRRNAAGTLCNLAYDNVKNQKAIREAAALA
jgi:HEAT repeat protein